MCNKCYCRGFFVSMSSQHLTVSGRKRLPGSSRTRSRVCDREIILLLNPLLQKVVPLFRKTDTHTRTQTNTLQAFPGTLLGLGNKKAELRRSGLRAQKQSLCGGDGQRFRGNSITRYPKERLQRGLSSWER